ncbi:MAG: class I SAM-dependent methyltransferase [Chitinophagaceae bacterium]
MSCLFCKNTSSKPTVYPVNRFNGKLFNYKKCSNCSLVYLQPLPRASDYELMYPPSYQQNTVEKDIVADPFLKLYGLRFSYGFQYEAIRKILGLRRINILDYGCGTGHFVANATSAGFSCDGAEFNSDFLEILKRELPESAFYQVNDVLEGKIETKYDVIRLSNVLEHLDDPVKIIKQLTSNLQPDGIFLVEGPIEENFCLATFFRKFYLSVSKMIQPGKEVSAPPFHTFFSNAKNQKAFFNEYCDLKEIRFNVSESAWPLPAQLNRAKTFFQAIGFFVARVSIFSSKTFSKSWGNTFIYFGRRKD